MNAPYGLLSDIHAHSWSQFSSTNGDGINTRLKIILDELLRAAQAVLDAGGNRLRVAGDLYHVRGRIEPSVFNPTFDTFRKIADMGVTVDIMPGNHDLETDLSDRIGNAMQQLEQIQGINVIVEPSDIGLNTIMIPWIEDLDELRETAKRLAKPTHDLIIHAPLNGVIIGLPDLGLDPKEVAAWGYKRVFIGHYHNHKEFDGNVYSIGATSHQTWSDPGTQAGFLLVDDDSVEFNPSAAPQFINIDKAADIDGRVRGNYVRLRLQDVEEQELLDARAKLAASGCAGFVDHSNKKRPTIRPDGATGKNVTLEVSVANYVGKVLQGYDGLSKKRIAKDALDILSAARQAGDE